ncbi:hypothetical protein [Maribacter polysaccharolyticus]|uniref:hypothetical protein n=1 Tax=Maribacter polysaccharolyticus TaxID=3020831 RepID=UPI00237F7CDA|nr:hypothetical protein [Maribacter polysaccharolyticus]MDE3741144.1 hypothetical protein [Maribacter polysaccharolyticus]
MKRIFSLFYFIGSMLFMKAQGPLNKANSESTITSGYSLYTNVGDVEMTKKSISMDVFKTYATGTLLFGVGLEYWNRRFNDIGENRLFGSFEDSYSIGLTSTYTQKCNGNWSVGLSFTPQLNATLKRELGSDDMILAGNIQIGKEWDSSISNGKAKMAFGLYYDILFGEPQLFPFVSYSNMINQSWDYTIGFPLSSLRYSLNEYHDFDILIYPEGNYTNTSEGISINGTDTILNSKLEFKTLVIRMDYNSIIDDYWAVSFGISYLPNTELRILDTNDTEIYSFGSTESLCINFGVKYKLN